MGRDQTGEVFGGWRDGEMEVFTPMNVYVCVGVDIPLATHDAFVR